MVAIVPGFGIGTPFKKVNPKLWSLGWHTGADISGPGIAGKPILAGRPGTVRRIAWDDSYGWYIELTVGSERDRYCHMPQSGTKFVKVGQKVRAGDRIGTVGSTGNVTGAHVHLERLQAPYTFSAKTFLNPQVILDYQPTAGAPLWNKPTTWVIGGVSPDVTRLGQRLQVHAKAAGLPDPYKAGPGPTFTETDRQAVAAFQRAQGWTGRSADGFPGLETFKRLAADPAPAKPSDDLVMVVGYGNIGPQPYKTTPTSRAQLDAIVDEILNLGVRAFIALELHEENGQAGALAYVESLLRGTTWKVARGRGGNHLLYDAAKSRVIGSADKWLGYRWASRWNLQDVATGGRWWAVGYHAPAGTSPLRVAQRATEIRRFNEWMTGFERVLIGVDKNNYSIYAGSPTKALRDVGRRSVYDAVKVENAEFDSKHPKKGVKHRGIHIDDLLGGSLVRFRWARQHPTAHIPGPNDHDWLVAGVTIPYAA